MQALAAAEGRRAELQRELARLDEADYDVLADMKTAVQLERRARQWRSVLAAGVPRARLALQGLLDGPILLKPEGDGYRLTGATRVGAP